MSQESFWKVLHGDCLEVLKTLPDDSVDSIVTDPPAGIAFMGREWDKDKGGRDAWVAWMTDVARECLRVIKPGGHALVWTIPRTSHWTGWAWEGAGWEPRDKIVHLFGSGFPKSLNVSKSIDKSHGAEREVIGIDHEWIRRTGLSHGGNTYTTKAFGSASGPNAGKITTPATDAAKKWDGWGTALKPASEDWWLFRKPLVGTVVSNVLEYGTGALNIDGCRVDVAAGYNDSGGASRFFYTTKASRTERGMGNHHPTVKSISLMRWLTRLVTPSEGIVLDPFAGSGTTLLASKAEGFSAIGIERESEYVSIIKNRLESATPEWLRDLDLVESETFVEPSSIDDLLGFNV
jgi:site-specific DNA-methyltransferase (adenine-specific)